jgi:hypothetical protein
MRNSFLYTLLLAVAGVSGCAQDFDVKRISDHIHTLAADGFQGRGTGAGGEKAARKYLAAEFKKLMLVPKGDRGTYIQAFPFRAGVHGEGDAGTAHNVVGYLDNKATHTVVIGAHYDHLGTTGQGSSLEANPDGKIHNGADDNASGVAGVLELARYYSTNGKNEKHNFLFVCFSGEELGLLGSKYFAEHAPVDLATVSYMINMDMIGRLDTTTNTVIVNGTGTSPVWEPLLKKLEADDLKIRTDSSGTGPSDHTSFYLKDLPVLHFFTGSHNDYHKPTDDWEKVNAVGEARVLKLIAQVIDQVDAEPKLAFLKTRTKSQAGRASFKVTLGIMPSYAGDADGLKVDGVSEGRPASKAGIQTGDVIVKMGEHEIHSIEHYMDALGKFEKGQTVPVQVKRKGQVVTLEVTF